MKYETSLRCPFCDLSAVHYDKKLYGLDGWECIHGCNCFFYIDQNVWYYRRIRNNKLCKKIHSLTKESIERERDKHTNYFEV